MHSSASMLHVLYWCRHTYDIFISALTLSTCIAKVYYKTCWWIVSICSVCESLCKSSVQVDIQPCGN